MATVSVEEREGKQITSILRINVIKFSFSDDWGENSIWAKEFRYFIVNYSTKPLILIFINQYCVEALCLEIVAYVGCMYQHVLSLQNLIQIMILYFTF